MPKQRFSGTKFITTGMLAKATSNIQLLVSSVATGFLIPKYTNISRFTPVYGQWPFKCHTGTSVPAHSTHVQCTTLQSALCHFPCINWNDHKIFHMVGQMSKRFFEGPSTRSTYSLS